MTAGQCDRRHAVLPEAAKAKGRGIAEVWGAGRHYGRCVSDWHDVRRRVATVCEHTWSGAFPLRQVWPVLL